ncbi:MAG: sugar ABC transporter permease [Ruminococcaceae bacterium]|nr:sugar ABC transporter permease [Oscillospiraceae bacterium]
MTDNLNMEQTSQTNVPVKKKKRKGTSLDKKKARAGWIFVLPFVIGFAMIYLPIIYQSLRTSLVVKEKGVESFYGWQVYYEALFASVDGNDFLRVLLSGVADMVLDIPMILLFSLFMAILLNQKMAGRAAFRAIFFVPVILSTGIMETIEAGAIDSYMSSTEGINDGSGEDAATEIVSALDVQKLFSGMSNTIGDGMLKYVTDVINRIYDIVNRSGVQMLVFLAGLQSISPAIYESVQIDGATAWETFWKITFPMISPMILVNAVYTVIDSFTKENTVMSYIENASSKITKNPLGVSTAMSWIYFLVIIALLGLVAALFSTYVFYQKKK